MEHTNTVDEEIEKYLPLLSDEQKEILLKQIKAMLDKVDYARYRFPVSDIKFDRGEMNGKFYPKPFTFKSK